MSHAGILSGHIEGSSFIKGLIGLRRRDDALFVRVFLPYITALASITSTYDCYRTA